jgi:hypothetical protein
METAEGTARRMWILFEPVHAVTYFAAEARAAFESAGLRGFWRGYFAGRAAPLGPVTAAPAGASFYTFSPVMIGRALPSVWELISPSDALAVRLAGAITALRRLLDGGLERSVRPAADLLAEAAARADCGGRPLAAATAALPVPDEPVGRLWQAATVLREHRGDGHTAALRAAALDGCEALVLPPGPAVPPREQMQPLRGWSDAEWDAATTRIAKRGLVGDDGSATPAGLALRDGVERATDTAASGPWNDHMLAARLADVLAPIACACAAEQPFPSPVGVPSPSAAGGASL